MKPVEILYLSQEDVIRVGLSFREVIEQVEKSLAEHGKKAVENPPKPGVHPLGNAFIHAMPGYIPALAVCGMKWVSGFPENHRHDLPTITGILVLNDVVTGVPTAVMDCRWITALRTAAVTAVTARYCARQDSRVVGIVGAGVQGRYNLLALREVLPGLKRVKVTEVRKDALRDFIEKVSRRTGLEIAAVPGPREAVEGSDVVVTATGNLSSPIVKYDWLEAGAFAAAIEATRAWEPDSFLRADKYVTDDWEQTRYYASHGAYKAGLPEKYTEVGEIIVGKKPGRENPRERILAVNKGLAIEDMAVAKSVYEAALERGIGTRLPLMASESLD